jgi:hypothetical protein
MLLLIPDVLTTPDLRARRARQGGVGGWLGDAGYQSGERQHAVAGGLACGGRWAR